jgi:hypothetical protein
MGLNLLRSMIMMTAMGGKNTLKNTTLEEERRRRKKESKRLFWEEEGIVEPTSCARRLNRYFCAPLTRQHTAPLSLASLLRATECRTP